MDLDVTSDESVSEAIAATIAAIGQVDVLINEAGTGVIGWQETFTVDD